MISCSPFARLATAVALAVMLSAAAAPGALAETVSETVERILADDAYQRDLPTDPLVLQQRSFLCDILPFLCGEDDVGENAPEAPEQQQRRDIKTIDIVLTLLVGAFVFALVTLLVPRLADFAARRRTDGKASSATRPGRTEASGDDPLSLALDDADRLAADGNFGEAIHLLLLRGIEDLRDRLGGALTPALTGREIVRRAEMATEARHALGRLTMATELCHFGGQRPNAADYAGCREDFLRFRQAVGVTAT